MTDADPTTGPPTTRWERAQRGYGARFARLIEEGADIHGEARLADVLLPREGTALDAGSGMGRVGAGVLARGHRVVAVEKDTALVEQSRRTYPDLPVLTADLTALTPDLLRDAGHPASYDAILCVGNVMVYLAEGTARTVLARLQALLNPGGRLVVGFSPRHGGDSIPYPSADFEEDAGAAGLRVQHRFGGYALEPPNEDYCLYVLTARARPAAPGSTG